MRYFIFLLLLVVGCKTSTNVCPMNKGYSQPIYWKYGHIKHARWKNIHRKEDGIVYYNNPSSKKVKGFYGSYYELNKDHKRRSTRLVYYDTCRTKIESMRHDFPFRKNRHTIHVYYNELGVKTKKTIQSNYWRNKTITWDKWGKRTVTRHEKSKGRMY